jgi:hypothetical protein
MRGHLLEVELNSLDPKNFDNVQDFFTKFQSLLRNLTKCVIDKSKQEKQMALAMMAKLGLEFSVFVSTFHSTRFIVGATWTMPSLSQFIDALTQEHDKLIHMGIIKGPKAHALVLHDGNNSQNPKSKRKGKEKAHADPKKEGYSKPFNNSSGSKGGKNKQGKKCGYCNRGNHLELACMKK